MVYGKAGFSTCPVKVYSFCNYEEFKIVLIENGVRENIFFWISFFVDGCKKESLPAFAVCFLVAELIRQDQKRRLFRNVLS